MSESQSQLGDDAGDGPDAGLDPRFTFSVYEAPRSCGSDEDCVILQGIRDCTTCCGHGAVARGEAERAHAAVMAACAEPGAPEGGSCLMACGVPRPACFEGICVALTDADAWRPEGQGCETGGGATTDGGAEVPDPGPGPSCGARGVQTGFEEELDPSWQATEPTAFRIDRDEPIAGGGSLRIAYRQQNAYLTIAQPDACAIRVAFTLRTRLLTSGLTLARIVVGEGSWFHVRLEGCLLSVMEEMRSAGAAGIGGGGVTWPVPEDSPVRVVVTLDLRSKQVTTAVAPLGQPLPEPRATQVRNAEGAIRAVELGSAPGVQSSAVGTVWIDDLVID